MAGKHYRSTDEGSEAGIDDPSVPGEEGLHLLERGDSGGPAALTASGLVPGLIAVLEVPPAPPSLPGSTLCRCSINSPTKGAFVGLLRQCH